MNAVMNIQVRVLARQATSQLAMVQRQVGAIDLASARAGRSAAGIASPGMLAGLRKMGSSLQWAGRQLEYNFTLPIVLAGVAATKWALDNEKAMTRVRKVYGDASMTNKQMRSETDALAKSFRVLSDEFGVNQAEVINVAADWAAAGVSGVALAKVTRETLRTMVLGEMDQAEATKALIAIQAQYQMSTADLTKTIDLLNMTENQTGTTLEDLIVSLSRSAGSARSAGVDIRHLVALTAALVPAAGTAANAGNALKTIFSRLLAPTKDASDLMKEMGINTEAANWQSLNAVQRLTALSGAFNKATTAQKSIITTAIGGRYQLNRFDTLMRALQDHTSFYWRSLKATSSETKNYAQAQKELNLVLQSNPQQLKQTWVQLQNLASEIITPLLPLIIALANEIKKAVQWFTNLDPSVQKLIGTLLLVLALMGPLLRYLGAIKLLLAYAGYAVFGLSKAFLFLLSPIKLAGRLLLGFGGLLIGTVASSVGFAVGKFRVLGTVIVGTFRAAMAGATGMLATIIRMLVAPFIVAGAAIMTGLRGMLAGFVGFIEAGVARLFVFLRATSILNILAAPFIALGALFGRVMVAMSLGWMTFTAFLSRAWFLFTRFFATLSFTIGRVWAGVTALMSLGWSAFIARTAALFGGLMRFIVGGGWLRALVTGFAGAFTRIGAMVIAFGRFLLGRFLWPITIIVTLIGAFRDKIVDIWHSIITGAAKVPEGVAHAFAPVVKFFQQAVQYIVRAFDALPEGVKNAIMAVVHVVEEAAKQVYKLFQYLNPFAHHSPSLVENVTGGLNVVRDEHTKTTKHAQKHTQTIASAHRQINNSTAVKSVQTASVQNTAAPATQAAAVAVSQVSEADSVISKAIADLNRFRNASKGLIPSEWADEIKAIKAQMPGILPMFMGLIKELEVLNAQLLRQGAAVTAQQKIVDGWKKKLDAANATLDVQQSKLDGLQKELGATQAAYDAASSQLDNYANAPIKGMQVFNDKLFENALAQKKVQLQMDLWEKKNGSIETLNDKFAKLNGEISTLQGQASALREKGAGSDVLGPINAQIAALQKQAKATQSTISNSPIDKLQKQMDKLQQSGDILQLQNDIKFDPLEHQIEKLANTTKELSYQDIINGMTAARATMDKLQPTLDSQSAAVARQQAVVDSLSAARDKLNTRYEREDTKLQALQDQYNKTADAISNMKQAMHDVGQAATTKAADKNGGLSGSAAAFKTAGAGNFPEPGGGKLNLRDGGLADINKWTADEQKKLGNMMSGMDLFGPIKDMWNKFMGWWHTNVTPILHTLGQGISAAFKIVGQYLGKLFSGARKNEGFMKALGTAGNFLKGVFHALGTAIGFIVNLFKLFIPDFVRAFHGIVDVAKEVWNRLLPSLLKLWKVLKPLVEIIGVGLIGVIKVLTSVWTTAFYPAVRFVIDIISDLLDTFSAAIGVIENVFKFLYDLFTGKWGKLWGDVKAIFAGVWKTITGILHTAFDLFRGIFGTIINVVKGFVNGIVEFFKWLADILVGHSIIPDMVHAIVTFFEWMIAPIKFVMEAIWAGIKAAWSLIKAVFSGVWNFIKSVFLVAWATLQTILISPMKAVWNGIVAIWHGITNSFMTVWNWIKSTFSKIWNGVVGILQGPFNTVKGWIATFFSTLWDGIKKGVSTFTSALSSAWDTLKGIFGGPIKFVIQTVLDDGLIWAWNKLVGWIPWAGDHLTISDIPVPKGLSTGGVIPGYQPGKDTVPAVLSKGEAVLRPEVTRQLGAETIYRWNRNRRVDDVQHFALGGVVSAMKPYGWVPWLVHGAESLAGGIGSKFGGPIGQSLVGAPVAIAKAMGHYIGAQAKKVWSSIQAAAAKDIPGSGSLGKWIDNLRTDETGGSGSVARPSESTASVGQLVAYAYQLLQKMGLGDRDQITSLVNLWNGESGWHYYATNSSSGAYGIPQALPASKLAAAGADWRSDPATQIEWGLAYIRSRYGSPATAYHDWLARNPHWYANGTQHSKPGWAVVGERGPELVNLPYGSQVFDNSATARLVSGMAARVAARMAPARSDTANSGRTTVITNHTTNNRGVTVNIKELVLPNITSADDAEALLSNLESLGDGSL